MRTLFEQAKLNSDCLNTTESDNLDGDDVTVNIFAMRQSVSPLNFDDARSSCSSSTGGGYVPPSSNRKAKTPGQKDETDNLKENSSSVQVSPCDSADSFDWRKQLSPIIRPKRSNRRSSFGFLRQKRISDSSTTSSVVDSVVVESPKRITKCPAVTVLDTFKLNSNNSTASLVPSSPRLLSVNHQHQTGDLAAGSHSHHCLKSIAEEPSEGGVALLLDSDEEDVQAKYQMLLKENQELRKRVESQGYDKRIGSFRTLFEELPNLREENETLKRENSDLNEKIQILQSQVMTNLKIAVEKAQLLELELEASERRNRELQSQISEARNDSDTI